MKRDLISKVCDDKIDHDNGKNNNNRNQIHHDLNKIQQQQVYHNRYNLKNNLSRTKHGLWFWKNHSTWVPYDKKTSQIIEMAFLAHQHKIRLNHGLFGTQKGYTIHFGDDHQIYQINNLTLFRRPVRRILLSAYHHHHPHRKQQLSLTQKQLQQLPHHQYVWQWYDDRSRWITYDQQTTQILEHAFNQGRTQVTLNHAFFGKYGGYTVYLQPTTAMFQQRLATHFRRRVRRITHQSRQSQPNDYHTKTSYQYNTHQCHVHQCIHHNPLDSITNTNTTSNTYLQHIHASNSNPQVSHIDIVRHGDIQKSTMTINHQHLFNEEPKWEYQLKNIKGIEVWNIFEPQLAHMIELTSKQNIAFVSLNFGTYNKVKRGYRIDYTKMKLVNMETNEVWNIRRTPRLPNKTVDKNILNVNHVVKFKDDKNNNNSKDEDRSSVCNGKTFDNNICNSKMKEVQYLTEWKVVPVNRIENELKSLSCPICLCKFIDTKDQSCIIMSRCREHYFHKQCIIHCYKQRFIRCPICNIVYGTRVGSQPKGTMKVKTFSGTLPGFPMRSGYYRIDYHFQSGVQDKMHPNPGQRYNGTSRWGYLPATKEGQEVLALLRVAFKRRLLFRIGCSVTTGQENCVIWNGVHHKTSMSGGPSNFGYPDATYLKRVKCELSDKGVRSYEDES